jgi:hypothetical protein
MPKTFLIEENDDECGRSCAAEPFHFHFIAMVVFLIGTVLLRKTDVLFTLRSNSMDENNNEISDLTRDGG